MTDILSLTGKDLDRELERIIKAAPKSPNWTPKEVEILKRLNGEVPQKEIAKMLGRSYESVKSKVKAL